MPRPPCDFSALHASLGVRPDVLRLSPMTKFVLPSTLLCLQRLGDSGTPLAQQLTDLSWVTLAGLDDAQSSHAIALAMQYTHTGHIVLVNSTLCAYAASCYPLNAHALVVRATSPLALPPPPPPPPKTAAPAPKFVHVDNRAPRVNKQRQRAAVAAIQAIQETIWLSSGTVNQATFRAVLPQLEALGPALAARAIREFQRAAPWRTSTESVLPTLRTVLARYVT